MTQAHAPEREESLVAGPGTTPWELARARLANPEEQWTNWLATTRPDGRPHVMPVIAFAGMMGGDQRHNQSNAGNGPRFSLSENDEIAPMPAVTLYRGTASAGGVNIFA